MSSAAQPGCSPSAPRSFSPESASSSPHRPPPPPIRSDGRSVTGTYESRTKDYCADGDTICQFLGTNPPAHFSYGSNAADAAEFVAGKV
ncbi:cutinase family protein [Amycolatopsis sp. NPDC049688]|uniref:cutinase family protein n=1 Tax=Amycolatopsis sp. NPDC049688 TaxID=3154733 RepID=UPI003433E0F6